MLANSQSTVGQLSVDQGIGLRTGRIGFFAFSMKHTETLVSSPELTKTFNERKFIWGYIPKYISLDVPHVTMVTLVRHLTIFSLGQRKIYWRIKTLMFASICVLFPSCKRKCSAQCFVIIFSSYITVLRSVTFTLRFSWLKFALKNCFFWLAR